MSGDARMPWVSNPNGHTHTNTHAMQRTAAKSYRVDVERGVDALSGGGGGGDSDAPRAGVGV